MAELLIRGGMVIDATGSRRADVLVRDGRIADVADGIDPPKGKKARTLDADGCLVAPGLVDLHAHLRQPGREEAETVETASRAAALGGYTAVVAMPNTDPAIDSAGVVREVLELGRDALCQVAVAGAITVGRSGERLAPMGEMAALGVRLFTDDGAGVQDGRLMRRALEYASALPGVRLAQHCEDAGLASGGHMHEGEWSSRLGIPGVPAEAEEVMVMRDIALCRLTGAPVHFLHLSTAGSIELVRRAKAAGLPVTAEAAPHHLVLTHAECATYDPVFKVSPPLRTQADVESVRAGCADGTVDAIATDHAPHEPEAKEQAFDEAPPGMLGLETALPLALEALGAVGMSAADVLALLSWKPAAIAGLADASLAGGGHGGPVAAGHVANLCVVDPDAAWVVDPARLASRSRNTPYAGRKLTGRVRHTIFRGEPVVIDAEAQR
jgi:dihydroorotase